MTVELPKEWYAKNLPTLAMDIEVGTPDQVGRTARTAIAAQSRSTAIEIERRAFGTLIQLLRREKGLSIEQLALAMSVPVRELEHIEQSSQYPANLATVAALSRFFELPQETLIQLADVTASKNAELLCAALRLTGVSPPVPDLTPEECAALAEFRRVLSSQGP